METDINGTTQAVYNYGYDLISMNRACANSYYQYDGLGSVKQMTDTNGAVVASYTYDGFGNLIASSGSTVNPYGFTGQQQFGEADNLVYLRARYYNPKVGRFISRDPIGYEGGINVYAYVYNNTVNHTDPYGLLTCEERCERLYRIDVAICGYNYAIGLCKGNLAAPIGWMICMEKARANAYKCYAGCIVRK